MKITELKGMKFDIPRGYIKPNKKYFPDAKIETVDGSDNNYKISSNLSNDKLYFKIFSFDRYVAKDIFSNCYQQISTMDYTSTIYNTNASLAKIDNDIFMVLTDNTSNIDYPLKVNLISQEKKKFLSEISYYHSTKDILADKQLDLFFVSFRSYIFGMMYNKYFENIKTFDYSFLDKLDSDLYSNDFFIGNNINPTKIFVKDIPILEQFNDQWIFYKHNFDKYRDKIFAKKYQKISENSA